MSQKRALEIAAGITDPAARNRLMGRVHALKRDAGLEEDEYRAVVKAATGHQSSGDCSEEQLYRVVYVLERARDKTKKVKPEPSITLEELKKLLED